MSKFEKELSFIKDEHVVKWATECVALIPDYFYEIPASSTGKYHPPYALGKGGLYRHTQAAVLIANELLTLEQNSHLNADLIIVSLILHDGWKQGVFSVPSQYTVAKHPLFPKDVLENHEFENDIPEEDREMVFGLIASHMGQWNIDYKTKQAILPKPATEMQKFVHLCDYLASRKAIHVYL